MQTDADHQRWSRLLSWLEAHGMEKQRLVECKTVPGAGRGLFASTPCHPSITLFTIPARAMMNILTLRGLYPDRKGQKLNATQMITLHLLLHRPNDQEESLDDNYGPYISTLPRDFDSHPLTWRIKSDFSPEDDPEADLLRCLPPSVVVALGALETRFWEDFKIVLDYLRQMQSPPKATNAAIPLEFPAHARFADHGLVMNYLWAWLNVNTRCIYYRVKQLRSDVDNLTLCPILDFANHSWEDSHIFPVINSEVWSSTFCQKVGGDFIFVSCSGRSIEPGEELFLQYGSHPNYTLFVEYGFVNLYPEDAIRNGRYNGEVDVQDIIEKFIFEQDSHITWVKTLLDEEGYWGDWSIHSSPRPAHPSYRLVTALRLCAISQGSINRDADLQRWKEVLRGEAETISDENESQWRANLLQICDMIIKRAQLGIQKCAMLDLSSSQEQKPWGPWQRDNIGRLWREELEVATAVAQSVREGEAF